MDTTRWKSILVPRELYEEIRDTAKNEGRTISGQLTFAYDRYKTSEGKKPSSRAKKSSSAPKRA